MARVCRRLRALCLAPQLLRSLEFQSCQEDRGQPARLASLLLFLQRHGASVSSLQLWVDPMVPDPDAPPTLLDPAPELTACLGMCGALPELRELTLELIGFEWGRLSWLVGVTRLTSLRLKRGASFEDAPTSLELLSRLTALRELHLSGTLRPRDDAPPTQPCLPPSLTALCLEGDLGADTDRDLPPQVGLAACSSRLPCREAGPEGPR